MFNYILLGIILFIALVAQACLGRTIRKTRKIKSKYNKTGADVVREILAKNSINDVKIVKINSLIGSHYDPRSKTIRLSKNVYNGTSIAAIGIATHECGHSLQDNAGYRFLRFRNGIAPLLNIISITGYILLIIGFIISDMDLFLIGTLLELFILLFHILSVYVEYDASSRGIQQLFKYNMIREKEYKPCHKILRACVLAYIAEVVSPLIQLHRLIIVAFRSE